MKKFRVWGAFGSILAGCLLLILAFGPAEKPVAAGVFVPTSKLFLPQLQTGKPLSCRFGINLLGSVSDLQLDKLPIGWYANYFHTPSPEMPQDITFAATIRLNQTVGDGFETVASEASIIAAVQANPGIIWLIGNEPDRRDYQDDIEPHVYAAAYKYLYDLIKTEDPTAQIYAGVIVQPTPIRLQYLDMVLAAYASQNSGAALPVDGWAIHNFILNEKVGEWGAEIPPGIEGITEGEVIQIKDNDNMQMFRDRIVAFRQWMADNGYGGYPLSVSEYGVLMPDYIVDENGNAFTSARVNTFMSATFDYMRTAVDPVLGNPNDNNKLVQNWSWYSTGAPGDLFNGYLFDPDLPTPRPLSSMGQNFASYVNGMAARDDLQISDLQAIVTTGITNTVTLTSTLSNAGNLNLERRVLLRLYDGDPANGGLVIGPDLEIYLAGCGSTATFVYDWTDVAPGTYQIFAVVDPLNFVTEADETDNQMQLQVTVNP